MVFSSILRSMNVCASLDECNIMVGLLFSFVIDRVLMKIVLSYVHISFKLVLMCSSDFGILIVTFK